MTEMNRQMSLFDILDELPLITNKLGKSIVKGVVDSGNLNPPDVLMELSGTGTLEQFAVSAAKLKGIPDEEPLLRIPAGWRSNVYAAAVRNRLIVSDRRPRNSASCLELPSSQKDLNTTLIYVDQNGVPWSNRITMYFNKPLYISYQSARDKVTTNATVRAITENSVTYTDAEGKEVTIPADTVVSAFGHKAYNPLQKIAEENCSEVYTIGSAVKAGNALVAIREGYQTGLKL